MILNEDNAGSYAYGLSHHLLKWGGKGDWNNFGATFNKNRLHNDDKFNYDNAEDFVKAVVAVFKERYPKLLKLYESTIKNLSRAYAIEKMKFSTHGEEVASSSVIEEVNYFNY